MMGDVIDIDAHGWRVLRVAPPVPGFAHYGEVVFGPPPDVGHWPRVHRWAMPDEIDELTRLRDDAASVDPAIVFRTGWILPRAFDGGSPPHGTARRSSTRHESPSQRR